MENNAETFEFETHEFTLQVLKAARSVFIERQQSVHRSFEGGGQQAGQGGAVVTHVLKAQA
jgi:hypothetical protein